MQDICTCAQEMAGKLSWVNTSETRILQETAIQKGDLQRKQRK